MERNLTIKEISEYYDVTRTVILTRAKRLKLGKLIQGRWLFTLNERALLKRQDKPGRARKE